MVEDTGMLGPEAHLEGVADPFIVHHVVGDGRAVAILQTFSSFLMFAHFCLVAFLVLHAVVDICLNTHDVSVGIMVSFHESSMGSLAFVGFFPGGLGLADGSVVRLSLFVKLFSSVDDEILDAVLQLSWELVEVIHVSSDAPFVAIRGFVAVLGLLDVDGGGSDSDGGDDSDFVEHLMFVLRF